MLGIYFTGTGNSRYVLDIFLKKYDKTADICALTDKNITHFIKENEKIIFSYPVQFSNIPKILKDFVDKPQHYTDKLKIDAQKCVGCGKCVVQCPMKNIHIERHTAKALSHCTMCYCCVNICPQQAITLLGKNVVEQGTIEKYL